MTTANRYAQAYRNASVETASPAKIVLMLFDGAIGFLDRALNGFDQPALSLRNETINNNLVKTQRIIGELRASLNHEAGGELARTLHRLYDYMDEQLRRANFKKDRAPILLTQELLGKLRSGWAEMMQSQPAVTAA